jgi:hypothetical protein
MRADRFPAIAWPSTCRWSRFTDVLSDFTSRSVIMLGKVPAPEDILPPFRKLADEHFPSAKAHVLVKRLSLALRLLMVVANRRQAPLNVLLRLDLDAELNQGQRSALEQFREDLRPVAEQLLLFRTANVQFHNLNSAPTDVAMAFINTWPAHLSHDRAQKYWGEHHGPLVRKVGLPPMITSYTQIHFEDSWDQTYQGLSFETITSQRELVKCFIRDSSVRKLNKILLEDEKQFTGPPLFFAFRELGHL